MLHSNAEVLCYHVGNSCTVLCWTDCTSWCVLASDSLTVAVRTGVAGANFVCSASRWNKPAWRASMWFQNEELIIRWVILQLRRIENKERYASLLAALSIQCHVQGDVWIAVLVTVTAQATSPVLSELMITEGLHCAAVIAEWHVAHPRKEESVQSGTIRTTSCLCDEGPLRLNLALSRLRYVAQVTPRWRDQQVAFKGTF